jgi:hypothetical protein
MDEPYIPWRPTAALGSSISPAVWKGLFKKSAQAEFPIVYEGGAPLLRDPTLMLVAL